MRTNDRHLSNRTCRYKYTTSSLQADKKTTSNQISVFGIAGKSALAAYLTALTGCGTSSPKSSPKTIEANGIKYQIQNGVLSQATKGDNQFKLGVMSDLHAHKENSEHFADKLNKEGIDAYFLAGDLSHSFGDYEGAKDDFNEIVSVVEPIAKTGKLSLRIKARDGI